MSTPEPQLASLKRQLRQRARQVTKRRRICSTREIKSCHERLVESGVPAVLVSIVMEYLGSRVVIENYSEDAIMTQDKKTQEKTIHVFGEVIRGDTAPLPRLVTLKPKSDYKVSCKELGDYFIVAGASYYILNYSTLTTFAPPKGGRNFQMSSDTLFDVYIDPKSGETFTLDVEIRGVTVYSPSFSQRHWVYLDTQEKKSENIRSFTVYDGQVILLQQLQSDNQNWWVDIPTVAIFNLYTGKCIRDFPVQIEKDTQYWVKQMLVKDGILYIASERGILLLDLETGEELAVVNTKNVETLFFCNDEIMYTAVDENNTVIDQILYC